MDSLIQNRKIRITLRRLGRCACATARPPGQGRQIRITFAAVGQMRVCNGPAAWPRQQDQNYLCVGWADARVQRPGRLAKAARSELPLRRLGRCACATARPPGQGRKIRITFASVGPMRVCNGPAAWPSQKDQNYHAFGWADARVQRPGRLAKADRSELPLRRLGRCACATARPPGQGRKIRITFASVGPMRVCNGPAAWPSQKDQNYLCVGWADARVQRPGRLAKAARSELPLRRLGRCACATARPPGQGRKIRITFASVGPMRVCTGRTKPERSELPLRRLGRCASATARPSQKDQNYLASVGPMRVCTGPTKPERSELPLRRLGRCACAPARPPGQARKIRITLASVGPMRVCTGPAAWPRQTDQNYLCGGWADARVHRLGRLAKPERSELPLRRLGRCACATARPPGQGRQIRITFAAVGQMRVCNGPAAWPRQQDQNYLCVGWADARVQRPGRLAKAERSELPLRRLGRCACAPARPSQKDQNYLCVGWADARVHRPGQARKIGVGWAGVCARGFKKINVRDKFSSNANALPQRSSEAAKARLVLFWFARTRFDRSNLCGSRGVWMVVLMQSRRFHTAVLCHLVSFGSRV